MTYCSKCNNPIGDITLPGQGGHKCPTNYTVEPGFSVPRDMRGQKCDMCGSTAIDHTENQCQLNRALKPNRL